MAADNVNITPGTGAVVAADSILVDGTHAEGLVQFVKLVDGTLNGTEPIAVNIGAITNALRVCPANNITDATYIGNVKVTSGAITETNSGSIKTAVELIDNAISGTEMQVDVVAALPAGTNNIGDVDVLTIAAGDNNIGNVDIVTMPADTFAADAQAYGKGVLCQGDDGSDRRAILVGTDGHVQVDVLALPASTNTIEVVGDAAENAAVAGNPVLTGGRYDSSGRTLGDGDVGAIALAADGAVHIDDGGNTITVDGTVTANLSDTDNAVLDTIDAALDAINAKLVTGTIIGDVNLGATDNAVLDVIAGDTTSLDGKVTACNTGAVVISSGTVTTVSTVTNLSQLGGTAITMDEGIHDAGCQRVTIATDDDGVAHLATIAGDTTNIETAVEKIDDWDATHATAAPADGAQIMGAAYSTALPTDVGADADAARLVTDRYGRLCTGLQPQAAKAIVNNADTTTAREIVAATATRRIFVTSLIISVDTAGNYWLEDGDATAVTAKMYFAANGGCAITFPEGTPLNTVTQNKALNVKGSTAGNVGVTVTYYLAV